VDLKDTEMELYGVTNPLASSDKNLRYFILPVSRVRGIKPSSYTAITGRPWNETVVTVLDRKSLRSRDNSIHWSLVWGSRDDVATLKVYKTAEEFLQVAITLNPDFNFESDYIEIEQHVERPNAQMPSGVKESWWLEHVAGAAPKWATFPAAWKLWTYSEAVQASAREYLLLHVPEIATALSEVDSFTAKENKINGWHQVKHIIDRELQKELGSDVTLGTLASNSWTAVTAMPLRMAQRMGNYVEDWVPPVPKPDHADPEMSGRVLMANPTGPYPTHGLGLQGRMDERYYMRQEGDYLKQLAVA
jgi:hypothetical protein